VLVIAQTSSGAQELAKKSKRQSLVYSGDDASAKRVAAELIDDVGFDPVDAGPLHVARYTEPFALLLARLAYEGDGGPELTYRFERFKVRKDKQKSIT